MLSIDWLDSPTLNDLVRVNDLLNEWTAEIIPGERPAPAEELASLVNCSPAHQVSNIAVATEAGEVLGGVRLVTEDLEGRRNDAQIDFLIVETGARRRGIGSALLEASITRARQDGRTRLSGSSAAHDVAAGSFARRHKAEPELLEQLNRVRLKDVDPHLLRGWVDDAAERATGYSLLRIDGLCPDELLPAFTRLNEVMNSAPHGPNLQDLVLTVGDVREMQRAYNDQGFERWSLLVRHDGTGALAGFTELMLSPFRPWLAFQWDTGVDPAHRGLGLGRWLKAANALRLLDERPDVEEIETWNANTNASMLAINQAMGFSTAAEWQSWEIAI